LSKDPTKQLHSVSPMLSVLPRPFPGSYRLAIDDGSTKASRSPIYV